MKKALRELFAFGCAGVIGFGVDVGVLYALKAPLGLYWGRAASFFAAVVVTWLFNRTYTFQRPKTKPPANLLAEFGVYLSCMIVGGLCNYGVYVIAVNLINDQVMGPLLAVGIGSLTGMLINYVTAKKIVFKHANNG
jgi:putative flippase GtrA